MVALKRTPRKWALSGRVLYAGVALIMVTLAIHILGSALFNKNYSLHYIQFSASSKEPHEHTNTCPIASLSELSDTDLSPVAGERHMVTPPRGGKVSLVCCETTKGNMSLLIHERWAPLGVARFLEMVKSHYFETKVPLFRCTDACQFGLAGDPEYTKRFNARLQDDPFWLPQGKQNRQNENGVKRFPQGFLTYAGSGSNSRSNQFVLTLKPNPFMGGGSPWEVPIGELVGKASFNTISKFFTGYGEKGPSQRLLHLEGNSIKVRSEWPSLDYITGCNLVDETIVPD